MWVESYPHPEKAMEGIGVFLEATTVGPDPVSAKDWFIIIVCLI